MSAFYDQASLVVVPSGYKSGKIYAQKPLTTDGQLTFTRASTATRVNASGLIETVSSGVPRLDYLGSSCPKILLEPQRTNSALQSSALNTTPWQSFGGTQTNNSGTSPDGTNNATLFQSVSTTQSGVYQTIAATSGQTVTVSMYVKLGTATNICLVINNTQNWNTVGGQAFTTVDGLSTTAWKRVSYTFTSPASNNYNIHIGLHEETGVPTQSLGTFYVYGVQAEIGAYMTSLIPTTSAAVTRLADAASKTGISSLIGQTEGTLFAEVDLNNTSIGNTYILQVFQNSSNRILLYRSFGNVVGCYILKGAGSVYDTTSASSYSGRTKIALAYKSGDIAFYINGMQIGTSSATYTAFASLADLNIDSNNGAERGYYNYNQTLLFKTRLTNAQLAELTTL